MYSLDRDGVMAGPQVVYGSPDHLYVASRRYIRSVELGTAVPDDVRTQIHEFDISDPDKTTYMASGSVPGFILNSYAISEYQGALRVATTEAPPWQPGTTATSKSTITVLRQSGATLSQVGAVSGLGAGDDLRGALPRRPRLRRHASSGRSAVRARPVGPDGAEGDRQARAPGYSAYLHPIPDTLLLGIGRDGGGVKAELFDVSDPAGTKSTRTQPRFDGVLPAESARTPSCLPAADARVFPLQLSTPSFTRAR